MQKSNVWRAVLLRMQSQLDKALFLLILSCLAVSPAFAACHVVTPSGSGSKTGADWNNAYAGLPATLVRGDIYYLADGTYPAYAFNTAVSGTTTIEVRKAQSYDNCTSTGWNTSTMGSAQAVFQYSSTSNLFNFTSSYFIVNGNGTQAAIGCGGAPGSTMSSSPPTVADCGIKLDMTTCTSGSANSCNGAISMSTSNVTHITVKYLEYAGVGNNSSEEFVIFAPYSGATAYTYSHLYMHNAGCVYMQDGLDTTTVGFSYFWGTQSSAAGCHGQAVFDDLNDSNSVFHDNVFRDIDGTAVWTFALSAGTHTGWEFYNNVIWQTTPASGNLENGAIACINSGVNCNGFVYVQNTTINCNSVCGIHNENTGSYTVENNLWYLNSGNSFGSGTGGINLDVGTGGTYTEDYNSFLQSGTSNAGTGPHDVTDASAPNPFVNWPGGNFNLASENSDWTNRLALGAPYTTDPNGSTRTTDRGAYQYPAQVPQPATDLQAAPH